MTRCVWISRDADGRPSCVHGRAHHQGGGRWACPAKSYAKVKRYRATDKGRLVRDNWNNSESARSTKELYELTRVRVS